MRYQCTECRHVYDERDGDDRNDVPPGTSFVELTDSWRCPCGAGRESFEALEDAPTAELHG